MKKDEEDLYIVFNILFRVTVGDILYPAIKNDELSYDLDVINNRAHVAKAKSDPNETQSSEEKIKIFKNNISEKMLIEIIVSTHFDHVLREIFRTKYSSLEHQECKHDNLAR
jgi:hypothetical protein